ncbi:hypothetical protein JTB14_020915 [Gonioctena quinquepunctata]|nr:hypothetical protein JTB14_020915 [Gonioctena quinquepunctata]
MSDCFICKKPFGDFEVQTVKGRGVKTLLERAKFKNDVDNELFLQSVSEVTVHIPCYHYYSDSRTDNVVRRLSCSSSSSSVSENLDTDFDFSNYCFICGELFQDQSDLRQSRQRKICNVRHEGTKKSILDLVLKRSDDKAKSIADRIANVSSLVNVGARYHKDCSKQLYSKKWSDEIRHNERKNNIDNAMEDVFAYLHENREECQFRLADLMKSIEGDYIPEKRTVIQRLKTKYKDDIVISNEGFSATYNSIPLYEDSCAFRPVRNILPHAFSQFVFDNADFNSNTIDGKNTLRAMGGIQCITPYDSIEADTSSPRVSKRIPASAKSTLGLVPLASYSKGKTIGLGKINVSLIENITSPAKKIVPRPCDFMWLYDNCVQHIISGHAYGRAVRAHLLVHLSISKIIMDSIEFTDEERDFLDDFINDIDGTNALQSINNPLFKKISSKCEESLTMLESEGPTVTLWIQYYRLVTL